MYIRISTLFAALALALAGGAHAITIDMGFSAQCSLSTNPTFSASCTLPLPSPPRFCYTLEVFKLPGGTQRTRQTVRSCDSREPTGNVRVAPKG